MIYYKKAGLRRDKKYDSDCTAVRTQYANNSFFGLLALAKGKA